MDEIVINNIKEDLEKHYALHRLSINRYDNSRIAALRDEAMAIFGRLGFPHSKLEKWRNSDLSGVLEHKYSFPVKPEADINRSKELFKCDVHGFDTEKIIVLNGWYQSDELITTLDNGVIIGSLRAAMQEYPDLVDQHFARYSRSDVNGLTALNMAMSMDGVFIYVPDNVIPEKPIQMVSLVHMPQDSLINLRNLIIVGNNSELTLVQCDDSIDDHRSFINTVSEFSIGENSKLDHYKLQNKNDRSTLINTNWFNVAKFGDVSTNGISLNGGFIRNETFVSLTGGGANADVIGLYLMDRNQHIDNQVFIDHAVADCTSNELFKGILDDHASGVFNGHILVRKDAQRTNAYQNNKNILISDKAVIDTKPFLEIYADDVKCSHGATVGQLDTEALFYLRSRGITFENARMLLMYAFAAEIVNKISIEELRNRIDDLVKQRLRGELSICDQCVLHCNAQEQKMAFKIDMSRI